MFAEVPIHYKYTQVKYKHYMYSYMLKCIVSTLKVCVNALWMYAELMDVYIILWAYSLSGVVAMYVIATLISFRWKFSKHSPKRRKGNNKMEASLSHLEEKYACVYIKRKGWICNDSLRMTFHLNHQRTYIALYRYGPQEMEQKIRYLCLKLITNILNRWYTISLYTE